MEALLDSTNFFSIAMACQKNMRPKERERQRETDRTGRGTDRDSERQRVRERDEVRHVERSDLDKLSKQRKKLS
jgi:hypothetical protein